MPKYAIIDLETTGGPASKNSIIDIAIYIHDGKTIIDSFSSLVDPGRPIPYNITYLTGINDDMVKGAPFFHEIAKDIVTLTKDCIFVAHNVSFDYGFIKEEFDRLGYNYSRQIICTVKESRKWLPGYKSYSLGKLCNQLGISIEGRHRAHGDALATVSLFEMIINKAGSKLFEPESNNNGICLNVIKQARKLPEVCGIYKFYNNNGKLIYVGKSKNIRKRVLQHLSNQKTKKSIKMAMEIADIAYEPLGSELFALLCENNEIKIKQPLYNRAQRRTKFPFGIFKSKNLLGYSTLEVESVKQRRSKPILSFGSKQQAINFIELWVRDYKLCPKLCGLDNSSSYCFSYHLDKCNGACQKEESYKDYNTRFNTFINKALWHQEEFLIIDKARHKEEILILHIKHGRYLGYAFIDTGFGEPSIDFMMESIKWQNDYKDSINIIQQYISRKKIKILDLKRLSQMGIQKSLF